MNPDEVDVVIYHSPCSDGTGSGYVAWKYLSEKFPERDVKYYPASIGASPPKDLDGKNVLICDYSYRKDVLTNLLGKVNKLLIIDHHKSAEKELADIPDDLKIFDMNHSGAMLTWLYFYPDISPPLLIKYIEDRDIWTKALPNTDDFHSWFCTIPREFEEYNKYLDDNLLMKMITIKGIGYGELNQHYTLDAINHGRPKFCKIKDKYYLVAYVNSTICKSDIGNQLFDAFNFVDFTATYSINDSTDSTSFSLRSIDTGVDVSVIARSLDGGGHAKASGVRVPYVTNVLPGQTFDNGNIYDAVKKIYYGKISLLSEENLIEHDVVYLMYPHHKYKLGEYLLQDKYTLNGEQIKVSQDICKKGGFSTLPYANIACIWDYDPINELTRFSIVLHDTVKHLSDSICDKFNCDDIKNIELKGFHTEL